MAELRRCLLNKRNLLILLVLLLVNSSFIYMQCNDTQYITKMGAELDEYIEFYQSYIDSTLENARKMNTLSILGNQDTYVARNLKKTVDDFSAISGTELQVGENRGVVVFSKFELTDLLLAGYGIYLILAFTGEYRNGLSLLVFSLKGGRRKLGGQRLLILLAGIAVASVCLYGSNLLMVNAMYPGMNPHRPIQSVPEFMKCTFPINIDTYIILTILIKSLAAVAVSMLIYACVAIFRNMLAIVLGGGILVAQALAYKLIISTSAANAFKYLNLYALLCGGDGFRYYYNLNVFGYPVCLLNVQLIFMGLFILFMAVLILIFSGVKPIENNSALVRMMDKIKRAWQIRKPLLPAFFWECKKILINQGGILIIAAIMYLAISASLSTNYRDYRNSAETMYYEQFGGTVTYEKLDEARKLEAKMSRYYNNAVKNLESIGDGSNPSMSSSELAVSKYGFLLPALDKVLGNMESAYDYEQKTGKKIELIEPFAYDLLFSYDNKTFLRNLTFCLIGVILVFSAVMNYEKTSNMELMINTLPNGRKTVINKVIWVVVISIAFSLPIHMIQYFRIAEVLPFAHLGYVAQSLEMYRKLPFTVSIRAIIILMYIGRTLISVACGIGVMSVSKKCKTRISAITLCIMALSIVVVIANVAIMGMH